MKILFYGTRDYDQIFFDRLKPEYPDIELTFLESNLYKKLHLWPQDTMESVRL